MFVIAELKDTIRVPPWSFKLKLQDTIRDEINRKLANKVLYNVGLCIMLKDLISLGDSLILPGDGSSHTEVVFRYIVFRPLVGEVLTAKIRCCSRDGVHVTMGFFDDILIPPTVLQHPSRFEEAEQAWVWEYPVEDGSKHDLFMDIGEIIKFRVTNEIFEETSPVGGPNADSKVPTSAVMKTPYKILGAINEPGLGVIRWWDSQTAAADEDEVDNDDEEEVFDEDAEGEAVVEMEG